MGKFQELGFAILYVGKRGAWTCLDGSETGRIGKLKH